MAAAESSLGKFSLLKLAIESQPLWAEEATVEWLHLMTAFLLCNIMKGNPRTGDGAQERRNGLRNPGGFFSTCTQEYCHFQAQEWSTSKSC
jgi:hypothetical protein